MKYQSNPEIKEDKEKVPKKLKLHKKRIKKKSGIRNVKKGKKL